MAVQLFLESEGSRNLESTRNHTNERSIIESEVRAPIAPKRETLATSTLSDSGTIIKFLLFDLQDLFTFIDMTLQLDQIDQRLERINLYLLPLRT